MAWSTTVSEFTDIDMTTTLGTVRQVRNGPANPWEVAWLLWHYTDDQHFYSIVLKPNGWELGKEDPAYPGAQRFLATGAPSPRFRSACNARSRPPDQELHHRLGQRTAAGDRYRS